jgi:hypothetical protein
MCTLQEINWELVIAFTAILIGIYSLYTQRKHNILSFKPIPLIVRHNYLNIIRVRINNKGTGPLIIKSVSTEKDSVKANNLKDLMPKRPKELSFVEFIKDFEDRAISPGEYITMIEFKIRDKNYKDYFNQLKIALNNTKITLFYTDIYNSKFKYFKEIKFGIATDEE